MIVIEEGRLTDCYRRVEAVSPFAQEERVFVETRSSDVHFLSAQHVAIARPNIQLLFIDLFYFNLTRDLRYSIS